MDKHLQIRNIGRYIRNLYTAMVGGIGNALSGKVVLGLNRGRRRIKGTLHTFDASAQRIVTLLLTYALQ